jgi:hypothetical protein
MSAHTKKKHDMMTGLVYQELAILPDVYKAECEYPGCINPVIGVRIIRQRFKYALTSLVFEK